MRYIRTIDGIYEYTSDSKAFDGVCTATMGINHLNLYKEIINQADTVEELCDEFIHGRMVFRTLKECLDYAPLGGEVYGAIWTDEGLIYKAKMKGILPNGEIDWELL